MQNTTGLILFMLLCLAVSFLLSGMETGVFALSRLRIRQYMRAGNRQAKVLQGYLDDSEDFLWTILVGNTMANFVLMSLTFIALYNWLAQWPLLLLAALIAVGFLFYSFGDLLPKMLFQRFPNRLCLALARPFRMLHIGLRPLVRLVKAFTKLSLLTAGKDKAQGYLFGNREELRLVMQESSRVLTTQERSIINRVLDLQHLTVKSVTVPISKVVTIDAQTPISEALRICRESQVTRLPVWQQFAQQRRLVGLISLKTLLYNEEIPVTKTVKAYISPVLYLDENLRLKEGLRRMQRSGQRLAIVLARDGHELGLISLQDILRVVFGEVSL